MKAKFLQVALVVLASVAFISCSKDDNNDVSNEVKQQPNTVTLDGKTESITEVNATVSEKYNSMGIRFDTAKKPLKEGDVYESYSFSAPYSELGKKVSLADDANQYGYYAIYFHKMVFNGTNYFPEIVKGYDIFHKEVLQGTDNWVQFTKDGTLENTYTVEFELNLEGKIVKGNYTGVFDVDN